MHAMYAVYCMHALMACMQCMPDFLACMQCMQGRSAGTALWAFKRTERAQQLQVQPKVGALTSCRTHKVTDPESGLTYKVPDLPYHRYAEGMRHACML